MFLYFGLLQANQAKRGYGSFARQKRSLQIIISSCLVHFYIQIRSTTPMYSFFPYLYNLLSTCKSSEGPHIPSYVSRIKFQSRKQLDMVLPAETLKNIQCFTLSCRAYVHLSFKSCQEICSISGILRNSFLERISFLFPSL